MIKDLSYYNKKGREESDSPRQEKPKSVLKKTNNVNNSIGNKSRMTGND